MSALSKSERMRRINQMLLEMAGGNFFFRLPRTDKNDNLEALGLTLNMLAEEIQESLIHQGYANSKGITKHIIQLCFMLDSKGKIRMINQKVSTHLSFLYADIIDKSFESFLDEPSKLKWNQTWRFIKKKNFYDTSIDLTFISKEKLLLPNTCFITTFRGKTEQERQTFITVVHHINGYHELEKNLEEGVIQFKEKENTLAVSATKKSQKPKLRLSFDDIKKLREAHSIIINNLEQELPSLKDFALQLGTNEYKLKYGFRELYGTSVYRFQKNERLRKAKMLIQYSGLTFESIAFKTGFKSHAHFTRTFKKRYNFSPRELRKKTQKDREL
ncbi:AraC family transcriptional regulator [Flagellimonas nanhaiensis]|uniref:AraC family transcriptional regulator n=1 Tax=Flagellimonas nanhaiensis TaxID=2292706 RepID=A0A371JLJ5_9FLAO|nr:AraC family transcriptional regulator [Allomuricauda nanhaiensis]RDY57828.1 AraC family transcriptional regulator [Allomuricauda nanhaiensis]